MRQVVQFSVIAAAAFGVALVVFRSDRAEIVGEEGEYEAAGEPFRLGVPPDGKLVKTDAEWKAALPAASFSVLRRRGTERAYTGAYWNSHADGEYRCRGCDQKLFDSGAKYDSGTGWPSYTAPAEDNAISLYRDGDGLFARTEVVCSRCDGHLGHVFDDGPKPTGKRYCMNSAALQFVPLNQAAAGSMPKSRTVNSGR